jgi:hypothetical protein
VPKDYDDYYSPGQAFIGSRRVKLPEFVDNRKKKGVNLSDLRNGHLYPQDILLVLISAKG